MGILGVCLNFGTLDLLLLVCFMGELVARFVFCASKIASRLCSVEYRFIVGVFVLWANLKLCWKLDCWLYWIRFEFMSFFSFLV